MFAHVGPEPLQNLLSRRKVPRNRNLFCPRYEACLDEAMARGWVSFTCARCARFEVLRRHEALAVERPA